MNTIAIFMGIVPLLIFVIIDSFSGLKAALVTAVVFAILEGAFSIYYFGSLDWITVVSVLLILILAAFSFYKKDSIHFKLQPVILSAVFAILFIVTYLMGKPLMYELSLKYKAQLPEQFENMLMVPQFQELLKLTSFYLGFSFLLHAAFTLWAALKLSNWWWIAMRGIGFYFFAFLAMFIARLQIG